MRSATFWNSELLNCHLLELQLPIVHCIECWLYSDWCLRLEYFRIHTMPNEFSWLSTQLGWSFWTSLNHEVAIWWGLKGLGVLDFVTVAQCWTFHSLKKHKLITTLWFSKVENDHAKNSWGEKYCDLYKLKIYMFTYLCKKSGKEKSSNVVAQYFAFVLINTSPFIRRGLLLYACHKLCQLSK